MGRVPERRSLGRARPGMILPLVDLISLLGVVRMSGKPLSCPRRIPDIAHPKRATAGLQAMAAATAHLAMDKATEVAAAAAAATTTSNPKIIPLTTPSTTRTSILSKQPPRLTNPAVADPSLTHRLIQTPFRLLPCIYCCRTRSQHTTSLPVAETPALFPDTQRQLTFTAECLLAWVLTHNDD